MQTTPVPVLRRHRRLRALAAIAGVGALATAAAVAPTEQPDGTAPAAPSALSSLDAATAPSTLPTTVTVSSAPLSERVLIAASVGDVETAPEPVEAAEAAEAEAAPDPEPARSVWDQLADCESGDWTGDGGFVTASANWSATAGLFEGGLQFHPDTWDGYRDPSMPGAAYDASREQQIAVGERVLDAQGWKAWPVCSRKLGLR